MYLNYTTPNNLTPDEIGEAVRHTCMLVAVRMRALGLTRTDREASRQVEDNAQASRGAARVTVSRLPGADQFHKAMIKIQMETRAAVSAITMPYGNNEGWRLLPNVNWDRLTTTVAQARQAHSAMLEKYKEALPDVLAQARANRGTLNVDIPTEEEIISGYSMEVEFRDIPEGNFKGMPESVSQKLKVHVGRQVAAAMEQAQRDTFERFLPHLTRFVERLELYDQREQAQAAGQDVGRKGVFRDSLVENLKELVEVVDSFNVLGDERLVELKEKVGAIIVSPEKLRDSQPAREEAREKARSVLSTLEEWLA